MWQPFSTNKDKRGTSCLNHVKKMFSHLWRDLKLNILIDNNNEFTYLGYHIFCRIWILILYFLFSFLNDRNEFSHEFHSRSLNYFHSSLEVTDNFVNQFSYLPNFLWSMLRFPLGKRSPLLSSLLMKKEMHNHFNRQANGGEGI